MEDLLLLLSLLKLLLLNRNTWNNITLQIICIKKKYFIVYKLLVTFSNLKSFNQ